MIQTKPGEVWWVDLGMQRKVRPLLVVSRFDPNTERALSVCVPCTTQVRGGNYEVPLPRAKWLPSDDKGIANVLGIEAVEHHRFQRRAGTFDSDTLARVRHCIAWMLELESSPRR
jgi:mRNA-degrading endonuclease toxin of MazEF toxin-antitoxin module